MNNIPTPHIECVDKNLIAPIVLMPGDPLRAKYIADTYLDNVIQFNQIRNVFGYTGYYKEKRISVMASGMGMPSIGIYSYELYNFYDVKLIIRIGSAGSYSSDLNVRDLVLVSDAYSESNYAKAAFNISSHILKPTKKVNNILKSTAKKLNIEMKESRIHSSDVFYSTDSNRWLNVKEKHLCNAVEMESFALFANASISNKYAACLLTISDSFVSDIKTTAIERQNSFNDMIKVALEFILDKRVNNLLN